MYAGSTSDEGGVSPTPALQQIVAFLLGKNYAKWIMEKRKGIGSGNSPLTLKNLKPAKKGEIRNPEGGRSHDPVKKALKRLTGEIFRDTINAAVMGDLRALKAIIENPNSSALQVGIATSLANSIKAGDWRTLESITERLVGKIPTHVDVTTAGGPLPAAVAQVVLTMPSNGREVKKDGS